MPLRYLNEDTVSQMAHQSPSEKGKATISAAPLVSGRAAPLADRSDRDGRSRRLRWTAK